MDGHPMTKASVWIEHHSRKQFAVVAQLAASHEVHSCVKRAPLADNTIGGNADARTNTRTRSEPCLGMQFSQARNTPLRLLDSRTQVENDLSEGCVNIVHDQHGFGTTLEFFGNQDRSGRALLYPLQLTGGIGQRQTICAGILEGQGVSNNQVAIRTQQPAFYQKGQIGQCRQWLVHFHVLIVLFNKQYSYIAFPNSPGRCAGYASSPGQRHA